MVANNMKFSIINRERASVILAYLPSELAGIYVAKLTHPPFHQERRRKTPKEENLV